MPDKDHGPYALSAVLQAELQALRSAHDPRPAVLNRLENASLDPSDAIDEPSRRAIVYRAAYELDLAALCLSGGGIRSASFALGVLQGLAERNLLQKFDYLSTVSGGGYIGSWLSAWRCRSTAKQVLDGLQSRRGDVDRESPAIQHLREYSSFLTPKVGLVSADTWAALAIILRNMLLNWLILLPALCLPVIVVKMVAAIAHSATFEGSASLQPWLVLLCALLLATSVGYKLHRLYFIRDIQPAAREQKLFLWWSVVPAVLAGAAGAWLANATDDPVAQLWNWVGLYDTARSWPWAAVASIGALVYGIAALWMRIRAWRKPAPNQPRPPDPRPIGNIAKDVLAWTVAGLVAALLVWLGARVYRQMPGSLSFGDSWGAPVDLDRQVLLVIFGMPWLLVAMRFGQMFYIMLRSYAPAGDFEREWLGRAGGWHLIAVLAWVVLSDVVFLGTELYEYWPHVDWMVLIGGLAALAIRFLGNSSATPSGGPAAEWKGIAANIGLALAVPLFAAILIMLLSMAFDRLVAGGPFSQSAMFVGEPNRIYAWEWAVTAIITVALAGIMLAAGYFTNVNRFSLHALYRNRLIRAFLGADRGAERRPDGFTGFDQNDNMRVQNLWPPSPQAADGWRPFQVINIALNLASSKRLAWQQRKATSFAVTPLFCGTADLGYRKTEEYGDPTGGISLGTAMAISGAAVSPNMGYHSSPSIAFLLTLFNVRLGWWLGNPGPAGADTYRLDAPKFAFRPLFAELFGLTHEDNRYVYLSDGGHFENLGIYEMVRRRCKWIVVVDGGQDANRSFTDLGNAVRKIGIDLGVRIGFEHSPLLQADKETKPINVPYFALGTIEYVSDGDPAPQGKILYIKPTVRGDEWAADIIAYKHANRNFPHQSTGDQWFDEPQLEGYRVLGYLIVHKIVGALEQAPSELEKLFAGLHGIDPKTLGTAHTAI